MGLTGCTGFQPFSAPIEGSICFSIPLLTSLLIRLRGRLTGSADGHACVLLLCRLSTHCLHVIIFEFHDHCIDRGVQVILLNHGFNRHLCKAVRAQWLSANMLCPFSPAQHFGRASIPDSFTTDDRQVKTVISEPCKQGVQTAVLPQYGLRHQQGPICTVSHKDRGNTDRQQRPPGLCLHTAQAEPAWQLQACQPTLSARVCSLQAILYTDTRNTD